MKLCTFIQLWFRDDPIIFNYMATKGFIIFLCSSLLFIPGFSQTQSGNQPVSKTIRVIMDNDFSGDPDGLFALTHLLLSPSVETRGIIGSHIGTRDFLDPSEKQADNAAQKAKEVLKLLKMTGKVPVFGGSNKAMPNDSTPLNSEAVDFIIKEASRTDTKQPLYLLCGAGLTEVASALLKDPSIQQKFTLVWIGGLEYPALASPPPNASRTEYNTNIDIHAAMTVFNRFATPIWQVPRDAYRQAIITSSQLQLKVKTKGAIGNFLYGELLRLMDKLHRVGETYILGDSPLVLLTALQTYFEPDPASSNYQKLAAPKITRLGQYEDNPSGRPIRVYTRLDVPMMFDDFFAKLELFSESNKTGQGSN